MPAPGSFEFFIDQREWRVLLAAHKKWLESMQPAGLMGKFLFALAVRGRDAAAERTHVDTGALSMSHRVIFSPGGLIFGGPEATIYIEEIINPRHGLPTTYYAEIEEARGGDHSFYALVIKEDLEDIVYKELDNTFGRLFF